MKNVSESLNTMIGAEAVLFSQLFHKGKFVVPWHQRNYDWDKNDVEDLLTDIDEAVKEKRGCYFLGAVILVGGGQQNEYKINDGQQRMVTVSLICAALCQRFAKNNLDFQREGHALRILFDLGEFQVYNLAEAEDYTPRIKPPKNDEMRYKQMIRGNTIGTNGKLTAAWRKIEEFLGPTNTETWWEDYFDYIHQHLEVACLIVPSHLDPNAVFETINCRGKPLDDFDRIRNFIYSHFREEQERRETVHENLETIRTVFPTPKKVTDYIRCRMSCQFGYLPKATLYRGVRQKIRQQCASNTPDTASSFVFDLVNQISRPKDLELFRRLTAPSPCPDLVQNFNRDSQTTKSPRNLSVFLRELRNYTVTQSLVFALMTKYVHESDPSQKKRAAKIVNKNLKRLTSFVMRTAFVSPKFEPSYFEKNFSDFAARIMSSNEIPDQKFSAFLQDCDQSKFNILNDSSFQKTMSEVRMHGQNTKKIKLLLLGINSYGRLDSDMLNAEQCSVEHILPKSEDHWNSWNGFHECNPNDWIHRLGNLTLISINDNKPGNKFNGSFDQKVKFYKDSSVAITRDIAQLDSWRPSEIEKRQKKSASIAAKVWDFS